VEANTDAPAWLVLTDTWFPGWRARVDGDETPVLRAHHAFRAVALPPGRHDVELAFRPRGLVLGAIVSGLALAVVLALALGRPRPTGVAVAIAVAVVLAAGRTEATLPEAPVTLSVSPSTLAAGQPVDLTLTPRGGGGPWDVYVVWLYSERAAFLGADGDWHPRPVPFRARLAPGPAVTGRWRNAGPPGPATLALVAVEPGADPLDRLSWRWQPSLARVTIAGPAPAAAANGGPAIVAVAGLVAVAIVLLWARGGPARPSSTSASLV
jgi:hypothetical protein